MNPYIHPALAEEEYDDENGLNYENALRTMIANFKKEYPEWQLADWLQYWALEEESNQRYSKMLDASFHDVVLAFINASLPEIDTSQFNESIINNFNYDKEYGDRKIIKKLSHVGTFLVEDWFQIGIRLDSPPSQRHFSDTDFYMLKAKKPYRWYLLNQSAQLWMIYHYRANVDIKHGTFKYSD